MQVLVLIISFILLGLGLTKAFSSVFLTEKREMLIKQNKKVARVFKQAYFLDGRIAIEALETQVNVLEEYLDASFIFLNNDDVVKILSNSVDKSWYGKKLNINKQVKEDNNDIYYQVQGDMDGVYGKAMLNIGYPIIIDEVSIGTIFISIPTTEILKTVEKSYQIITLFTVFAIGVAFILVYFFSRKISLPLIEINKAAKIMVSGNFKKKIQINSKDEIGQLASVLNEMGQNLEWQERRRREFISNISHDIRSPLTSMRGFLQAIIDGTIEDNKKEKYLKIVFEETERLTRLANNILDINNLDNVDIKKNNVKFNINELIKRVVISFEIRIIEKEIDLKLLFAEEETIVFTDIEKVERIIYNILDNAIKFIENGKTISINTKIKDKKVYISIVDEGPGIDKNEQRWIFDRFYKGDYSRGKDKKGSGLGLSIVKEFIVALGEDIELKSELSKGSEFIFTLTKA